MDWLPLTLLCAVALASADAVTKARLAGYAAGELLLVRFGLTGLLLAPALLIWPLPPVPAAFWAWMGVLVPLEILAMGLYVVAIRDGPLSHTLPYLAFTPVLTTLTSWAVLGERVSPAGFLGVSLIVGGAWLLNREPGSPGADRPGGRARPRGLLAPFGRMLEQRGARLMLAVAAIYSLTAPLGKAAMRHTGPESFGPFYFALIGGATLLLLPWREPHGLQALWRRPVWNLAVAALLAVMVVTHFLALARVEVAYMIAVKRTSLLFGILLGWWLFGERGLARNLLATGLMVGGVALIALAR
jgi:drug/metabolite transporter (DMT)-like permease